MASPVLVPQVGQDLTTGKIVALHVSVGDIVKKGDIVAEVESEKASFEVEAFEEGTVLDILYKIDDEAPVLEPLMFLGKEGETVDTSQPEDVAPANDVVVPINGDATSTAHGVLESDGIVRSSPLARRLAVQNGLDLKHMNGTGPKGSVVKRDIEAVLDSQPSLARSTAAAHLSGPADFPGLRSLQNGTGDPVLFLHGFGAELAAWRPFVMDVDAPNPMVALDLPAHGAAADASATSFDDLVDRIARTIDGANATRLHLVGHSLGAAIAASLAGRGTLDIRSMTLIAPAGLGPKINGDFLDGFLEADSIPALEAWMKLLVHGPASIPAAMVRATLAGREGSGLAVAQAQLRNALFSKGTQLFSVRDDLGRYSGPTRVIVGANDQIIPSSYADILPGHVALHRLADVGHLPQLEAQTLVSKLVAETIRSTAAR